MSSILRTMMSTAGETLFIIREAEEIGVVQGAPNKENGTHTKFIMLYPDADVIRGDILVGRTTGNNYRIGDTRIELLNGKPFYKKAYYSEEEKQQPAPIQSFHITGNVYGSNFGVNGDATITNTFNFEALEQLIDEKGGEDKEELKRMIEEIRELFDDSEKVKKGALSKFSTVMEKHSWITGAVAQLGLGFLTGQVFK